ncbi:RsmB/NOP family class I SAM-dependent RNA methyltransferase, partial [Acidianus sp. RZ1]|uniref:RsmB/NOP family class I SAM-dependent RNA methyltransferase n=1 Tax=Acidianus sp. RZ1 TaxID=1540082 RepID=UPI001491C0B1
MTSIEDFLSTFLYYVEQGDPIPIAFSKTKNIKKLKKVNYDNIYEKSRELVLSYFSLNGRRRSEKIKEFLSNGVRPLLPNWAREELVNYLDVSSLEKSFVNNTKWIRINTLKTDVDKVILGLEKLGIMIEQDNDIYYMAKVLSGNIKATEYYRNFSIIFQDKASSAVVEALKPENGDLIFDVSSSPGIKASQISAITENKATLVLADMDRRRLHKEIELLRKLGVNMERINIINQDSSSNSVISADKILFDAPCSSSGIIANEPSILLKLEKSRILSFSQLQQSILDNIY